MQSLIFLDLRAAEYSSWFENRTGIANFVCIISTCLIFIINVVDHVTYNILHVSSFLVVVFVRITCYRLTYYILKDVIVVQFYVKV